jgi:hypothetical protein
MPIRISSLTKRISHNGTKLHQARTDRVTRRERTGAIRRRTGAHRGAPPAQEERAKRQEQAAAAGDALDKLVRTHHQEAKEKPKATKGPKEP